MKKGRRLEIRLTEKERNRLQMLADIYAGGNLTQWLVHGGLNAPRVFLTDCKLAQLLRAQKSRRPKGRRLAKAQLKNL